MLSEVNELGSTIAPLAARLDEYERGLENFMLDSLCQVDNFKQDHIAYLSHHLQVKPTHGYSDLTIDLAGWTGSRASEI